MAKKKKRPRIDEMTIVRVLVAIVLIWLVTTFMVISWTVRPIIKVPVNNEADLLKELRGAKTLGDPAYVLSVRSKLILEYMAHHKDLEARKQVLLYKDELRDSSMPLLQRVACRDQLATIEFGLMDFQDAVTLYNDNVRDLSKFESRQMKAARARELNNRGVAQFIVAQIFKDNDELKKSHFKASSDDYKAAAKLLQELDKAPASDLGDKSAQIPGLSEPQHLPLTISANKDVLKNELDFTPERARPAVDF